MSKRGATHKGPHRQRMYHKARSRKGQRNRMRDDFQDGELSTFPPEKLAHMVRQCRSKVPHKSYGAAYAAKRATERDHPGSEYSIYECPICGKWHLTTHPWEKL